MTDMRDRLLTRLQTVLATLAPGVTYPQPIGVATQRVIETDLGGRVYSRWRGIARPDPAEFPYVEIVVPQADLLTCHDDGFYKREIAVQILAYASGTDAGDGLDETTRPTLDTMLADISACVESFPYWTDGVTITDPLTATHGPIIIIPRSQDPLPSAVPAHGVLVLDYTIAFLFPRLQA